MTRDDAPLRGPFHDWYETWRAGQADRLEAAAAERRRHERDDRRIARLLIAYAGLCGLCGALAVALV
ncbi:MAG: hypothetical protein INR64_16035, partial [Caulobacteraceae bacterium]|nr:hypothetical protein [Caulobacter sp.]